MADIFITSAATRGGVRVTSSTDGLPFDPWTYDVRDNITGYVPSAGVNTNNTKAVGVQDTYSSGLDLTTRSCNRYFMAFDTSAITENVLYAELWINKMSAGFGNGDFIPVKATAPTTVTNIASIDYGAIFQYEQGYAMNANTIGNVVDYADSPTTSWVTGWNSVVLNTAACADINALTQFKLALVNYTYDYLYQEPIGGSPGTNVANGINAATNPPYLYIETGSGQWVLSIDPALTFKVNGVTGTNIKFVNRVGVYALYRTSGSAVANPGAPVCDLTFSGTDPVYCIHGIGSIIIGDYVYTDALMTTPLVGGNLYYGIWNAIGDPSWSGDLYQISNTGQVTAISNCAW